MEVVGSSPIDPTSAGGSCHPAECRHQMMTVFLLYIKEQKMFRRGRKDIRKSGLLEYKSLFNLFTNQALCRSLLFFPFDNKSAIRHYESKGHRFESCWACHEPSISFALSAVFLFYNKLHKGSEENAARKSKVFREVGARTARFLRLKFL